MESIEAGLEDVENSILELEKCDIEYGRIYRTALEHAVLLLRGSEKAPSYIQERVKRLHALLYGMHEQMAYRSSCYNPLHRQISKIKDRDISGYFSPLLQKHIDRMYPCTEKNGNLILFSLGRSKYAVFGRIKEQIDSMESEKISEILEKKIPVFPEQSEVFQQEIFNAARMLHVQNKIHGEFALYCDEVMDVQEVDQEHTEKNLYPLKVPYPHVPGRIRFRGNSYCLIRPWLQKEKDLS